MIRIFVRTSRLSEILGKEPGFAPLVETPIRTVNDRDELEGITVYEVMEGFHNRASELMRDAPGGIIAAHQEEITRVAREEYHCSEFACDSTAVLSCLIGPESHGQVAGRSRVFLPDLCTGISLRGFIPCEDANTADLQFPPMGVLLVIPSLSRLPHPVLDEMQNDQRYLDLVPILKLWQKLDLASLNCHMCDWLADVFQSALSFRCTLLEALEKTREFVDGDGARPLKKRAKDDPVLQGMLKMLRMACAPLTGMPRVQSVGQTLVLDPTCNFMPTYRTNRRSDPAIPQIGGHRILSQLAVTEGIARPFVSGIWPACKWRILPEPIRELLLRAAEVANSQHVQVVYPNVPLIQEMRGLEQSVSEAEGWWELSDVCQGHAPTLRRLGLFDLMDRASRRYSPETSPQELGEAIEECRLAFNTLQTREVLDLYPLHKRVLGLVEYIVVPRLISRGVGGNAASALWTNAFTGWRDGAGVMHSGLSGASLPTHAALLATLETEGHWLLHAGDHEAAGRTGPIDLAALLDGIVARMSSAGEVAGVSVSLEPATPQVHARQLAALADRSSNNAACMTLYLGKVALMLRNAVEHGTDLVVREGLLLETPGYWTEERGPQNNRLPVFDWLRNTATRVAWRSRTSLPATLPGAANSYLLTPASLQRCLTLLSLVVHGAFSQLRI